MHQQLIVLMLKHFESTVSICVIMIQSFDMIFNKLFNVVSFLSVPNDFTCALYRCKDISKSYLSR